MAPLSFSLWPRVKNVDSAIMTAEYTVSQSDNENVLQVQAIACIRSDRMLFQSLNFTVSAGQVVLVEGRNGTGKTSLLRILCGIRRPDEGDVLWQGESIESLGGSYHGQLAYLGHMDGIKRELSAEENLQIARALGRPGRLGIDEALLRVDLDEVEDIPVNHFSAGMRRRLALARLLVTDSRLWVLDEPFTSLDVHGIALVEALIAEHVANGGMVVMTSHHQVSLPGIKVVRVNLSEDEVCQ